MNIDSTLRSVALVSLKSGNQTGTRYFIGTKSARELRALAGDNGLTGAARRRFIRDGLTTPDGARKAAALELVGTLTAAGYSADTAEVRKTGAVIKFAKLPKAGALRRQSAKARLEAEAAALRAEIEAMKAAMTK
jgi:hypothetical protein